MEKSGHKVVVLIISLSLTALLAGGGAAGLAVWKTLGKQLQDAEFLEAQLKRVRPEGKSRAAGPPPALVRVGRAERKMFRPQREIIGRLIEVHKVTVASEVTGAIIAVPVEEGARVVAGKTVLAEVDQIWSRLARQRYEAELKSAEAMLQFELVELERFQKLTDEDAISRSQLELKTATVAGLQASMAKSRTAMEEEDQRIARSTIRAPLDGVVVAKHAERGGHVTVGTPLVEIISSGQLDARLMVPESAVNLLEEGERIAVRIDPLVEEVEGTVVSVTPYGPTASRTFPVRVRLDDQQGRLKVGMSVTASIPTGPERESLVVSRDAVLVRPDGATVWVATAGEPPATAEVQPVPVKVSDRMRDQYAIEPDTESGQELLVDGATVVIEGAERLMPGQLVRIVTLEAKAPLAPAGRQ